MSSELHRRVKAQIDTSSRRMLPGMAVASKEIKPITTAAPPKKYSVRFGSGSVSNHLLRRLNTLRQLNVSLNYLDVLSLVESD